MTLIELTPPAVEPVSLDEAKSWARIERDDEDALLETLIRAARETVERQTRLLLAPRAFRLCVDAVGADGRIEVKRGPLRQILGVAAYDGQGTPAVFGADAATIARDGTMLTVSSAVRRAGVNGIEVELEAGFQADEVPEGLKVAMLRIVATAYETRALIGPEMQPAVIPPIARALIAPFRAVPL